MSPGLTIINPANYGDLLDPLPVAVIPGIGKQTLQRLHAINVRTMRDLRLAPDRELEPVFGRYTRRARDRASGIDNRPVVSDREEKSISAEETYDVDLSDRHDMERELLRLADTTARRLRKAELQAGTVQIKVRLSDFQTFTRQRSQQPPVSSTDQIFHVARALLGEWLQTNPDARIRLLGVGSSKLSPAAQPDLFGADAGRQPRDIDKAADAVRERFGTASVRRARSMRGRE